MTKLTDTQLIVLTAASQRDDRLAMPLPPHLKGGAAKRVVNALMGAGMLKERRAKRGEPVWREDAAETRYTLVATDAAMAHLGITDGATPGEAQESTGDEPATEVPPKAAREGSKQAQLIEMLRRPEGVTVPEAANALGWQLHTVRGAFAGALKKKLGLTIDSEKVESRGRVYRIAN